MHAQHVAEAPESKTPTATFCLYPLIQAKKWEDIHRLIDEGQLTQAHLSEIKTIDQSFAGGQAANMIGHLLNDGQYNLIERMIRAELITSDHLAPHANGLRARKLTRAGELGNVIFTICTTTEHSCPSLRRFINLCLEKNLITPGNLNYNIRGDVAPYLLMQKLPITDDLRVRFKAYCEASLEESLRQKNRDLFNGWLAVLSPHVTLAKMMKLVNASIYNSSSFTFEEKLNIIINCVSLSSAADTNKRDVIRFFLFEQIKQAKNKSQLDAIEFAIRNNNQLKSIFTSASLFKFQSDTSPFARLNEVIEESLQIRREEIAQKERDNSSSAQLQ